MQRLQEGASCLDLACHGQHKGGVSIVWFYQIKQKTEEDAKVSVKLRCTYECFSLSRVDLKLTNQFLPVIWLVSENCFHIQVRILRNWKMHCTCIKIINLGFFHWDFICLIFQLPVLLPEKSGIEKHVEWIGGKCQFWVSVKVFM